MYTGLPLTVGNLASFFSCLATAEKNLQITVHLRAVLKPHGLRYLIPENFHGPRGAEPRNPYMRQMPPPQTPEKRRAGGGLHEAGDYDSGGGAGGL